ncbi:hypothetical protein AXG93_810s1070 [Marchantia polymorpha subsp. ruderalis]|uniref:CCHC-type domain-containing protein n=1 Tax=Marchantia polymorpha subsp. ruderalis TaxID=1480154 RepID=A0A176WCC1_MARPO|nr:hypothetical protein AXG93_810s1070 [Marchantia polymorpha subsp. ruderalis]
MTQPIIKHSYLKFKCRGEDDDADSYIKLFESISITNKEEGDDHRLRIFLNRLRKKALSKFNHESTAPAGIDTWAKLQSKSDVIKDVIVSAEAFETSTLNCQQKDRGSEDHKPKHNRRRRRLATPLFKDSSSLAKSNESEASSSSEEEQPKRKAAEKKKNWLCPRGARPPLCTSTGRTDFHTYSTSATRSRNYGATKTDGAIFGSILRADWNNCGAPRHWAPNYPQPRRQMEYVSLCSNCRMPGHTAVECEQQLATRPSLQFVTSANKDNVHVNQVDLSAETEDQYDVWPKDKVLMGKVETRSATCRKDAHLNASNRLRS